MDLWNHKLTDKRSARVRLLLNTCSALIPILFCWVLGMRGTRLGIVAGAFVFLAGSKFAQDHWRLRHPDASPQAVWLFGAVLILLLLFLIPLSFMLVR